MGVSFIEGSFVWNEKMGVGKVALSSEEEVFVEFESGGQEIYPLDGKKPPLTVLQPDGFWLKKKNDGAAFAEAVKANPMDALSALLVDNIEMFTPKFLKDALCPAVISADAWDEWLERAVAAAKNDPRFEVASDKKITFQGDMSQLAEDLMLNFRSARSLKEKMKVCKDMLRLEAKSVPVDDVKEAAIAFFTGTTANKTNNLSARLEALFFLKELEQEQYDLMKEALFSEIAAMELEAAAEAIAETSDNATRKNLMDVFRDRKSESFIDISLQLCKRFKKTQRDWTLDYLLDLDDSAPISAILEKTMSDIATNLQPFVWIVKTTVAHPEKLSRLGQPPQKVIPAFFKTFANMYVTSAFSARPKDDRSVSKEEDELLKLLKDHKKLISFLKKQPEELIQTFASHYKNSNAIPNELRDTFIKGAFADAFPNITVADIQRESDKEEMVITRDTYEKFKKEFDELVAFRIDEATKAIQTAREWGDISENAELNVAQENQRKLLLRRSELEHILDNCRILN